MIAEPIFNVGTPYDLTGNLPIDINVVRVDSRITEDTERDDYFKARVLSAIQNVERESGFKVFGGRFVGVFTENKIRSHGNAQRKLTLPALDANIIPQGSDNADGNPSQTNIDFTGLRQGYDKYGQYEIYPNKCWPLRDIVVEFTAGIPASNTPMLTFNNPDLRQVIADLCRYTFYREKEDFEQVKYFLQKLEYASRDEY